MAGKIRVLVVDDSFFMRKLIRDLLESTDDIEIVGEANNGLEAVKMAGELEPDVITMDYNMPEMNGADATEQILSSSRRLPAIIMLSARTTQGAAETLECLKAGAVDFLAKPSGEVSIDIETVKEELLAKLRISSRAQVRRKFQHQPEIGVRDKSKIMLKRPAGIIAIGASTGGPPTLEDILVKVKGPIRSPILIIQHMPEKFTKSLAERLDKNISIKTKEAEEGEIIKDDICLIAPGGWHTVVENRQEKDFKQKIVHLNKEAPIFGLRPAIDIAFNSIASHFGDQAIGIILTGMGSDGTKGAEAIKAQGGHIIAQAPQTAIIDSMPDSVIKAGLADEVLTPDEIAQRIMELSSI